MRTRLRFWLASCGPLKHPKSPKTPQTSTKPSKTTRPIVTSFWNIGQPCYRSHFFLSKTIFSCQTYYLVICLYINHYNCYATRMQRFFRKIGRKIGMCNFFLTTDLYQREVTIGCVVTINTFVILFDLILYVQSTIFQLCRDGSSWVKPALSKV